MLPFKPSSIDPGPYGVTIPIDEASSYETPVEVGANVLHSQTVRVHFEEPRNSAWIAVFHHRPPKRWGGVDGCLEGDA